VKRVIIISIFLLAACAACKKAKGPANGNSVQPNNNRDSTVSIKATINGAEWQSDSAFGYLIKNSGNDSGVVSLMIKATKKSKTTVSTINLIIYNFTGPNTYTINPPVNSATYYVGNDRHFAILGKVVVTSDTLYALKGTFNFLADSINVTGGVFNVAAP
jgi:hypothetical protein